MEPGIIVGARTFQQRLDDIGYLKEDKLTQLNFTDPIWNHVMDDPWFANDKRIYDKNTLATLVDKNSPSPLNPTIKQIQALFEAQDKREQIEIFVKKQEKKFAEKNNLLAPKIAKETVQQIKVETNPTVIGEFTWSYIYSFRNTIYEYDLQDIRLAQLGNTYENTADFLWQLAANNVVTTKDGLRKFYNMIQMGGLFIENPPQLIPDRPPPAPKEFVTLKSMVTKLKLPYLETCIQFNRVGYRSEAISCIYNLGKISSPLLLLRKLIESGKVNSIETLVALLQKHQLGGLGEDIQRLENNAIPNNNSLPQTNAKPAYIPPQTNVSYYTDVKPAQNPQPTYASPTINSQQTYPKPLNRDTVALLFRDLPESKLKAIALRELRQNKTNGFLISDELRTRGICNNEQQASKLFINYNISGLIPFIHQPDYSFKNFSDSLVIHLQKLYGNVDKNILSRIQEREIEAEQRIGLYQDHIIKMLILCGKVTDTYSFSALIDKYS